MGSSSKLNYQIYKYILHLDMQNIYSTQWIRKIKEILQRCGLFNILVNQHNIRIEYSKAIRLQLLISERNGLPVVLFYKIINNRRHLHDS